MNFFLLCNLNFHWICETLPLHSNYIFRFWGTEANRLSKFRRMTVEVTVIRWNFRCFRMINPKFGGTPAKQQQTGKFHGASVCQNFHQRKTNSCAPKLRRFSKTRIP
jgi:hypothetical protein